MPLRRMSLRAAAALVLAACAPSNSAPTVQPGARPLLIVVSLDGFRPDYLDRPAAVRLRALAARGARAERMIPAFPTKTFPNHFTLATGLLPEHHGIVANTMVDSVLGRFTTADTVVNRRPGWWHGEPIWIAARRQGLRSATMFWVGSEVPFGGLRANYWRSFDPNLPSAERIDQVLAWLSLPQDERPDLVMLYLNRVDVMGHRFGPVHPAVDSAIAVVDSALGRLVDGLAEQGLQGRANLVVVSDHGMTAISPERVIYLDDYLPLQAGEVVDLAPVTTIDPAPGRTELVIRSLTRAHPHLTVYRREEMPDRFRFRANARITPVIAIADDGWTISTRAQWRSRPLTDLGNHGYDHQLPSMAAILIGAGPAFRPGAVVPPLQNIHVYALLCFLLGVRPAPNDGSLDSIRTLLR